MTSVLIVEDESLADPLAFLLRRRALRYGGDRRSAALAEFDRAGADIVCSI